MVDTSLSVVELFIGFEYNEIDKSVFVEEKLVNELRKEILAVDEKVNKVFRVLLDKIDSLSPKQQNRKQIGFKRSNE